MNITSTFKRGIAVILLTGTITTGVGALNASAAGAAAPVGWSKARCASVLQAAESLWDIGDYFGYRQAIANYVAHCL